MVHQTTNPHVLKPITSFIKFLTYSNLFVSICVAAFTHVTYIIYNLPQDNILIVLLMVFSFTFFTYNGQRLFRLKKKILQPDKIGERLQWVIKYKTPLTFFTAVFGLTGLVCTYFIGPYCFIILIPMGIISIFYVVPLIPFYSKSPALRELPYLKILLIALVWSLIIIWLPHLTSPFSSTTISGSLELPQLQVFLFVIAITLPFDIRDIEFDKTNQLKTIPQFLGIKKTILLSEILLLGAITLSFFLNLKTHHFYALIIGYLITMIMIAFTNKKRKELFFAGLIEGSVIVLYLCVLISEYFSFL